MELSEGQIAELFGNIGFIKGTVQASEEEIKKLNKKIESVPKQIAYSIRNHEQDLHTGTTATDRQARFNSRFKTIIAVVAAITAIVAIALPYITT